MKIIITVLTLILTGLTANAQCDKKVKWYSAKAEMYHTNGNLLDTKLDSVFVETEPGKIRVKFQYDDNALEGIVKEKNCEWKEPFKNGKTIYHASVTVDGINSDATFTIEAKYQKTTLSIEIEARKERKFIIYLDRYEEI